MLNKLFFLLICFSLISCSTFEKKEKVYNVNTNDFAIKWDVEYIHPTDKEGYLIVINPETKKQFKISYKDFFVMDKAYKNWRIVEKANPMITSIVEKNEILIITFNYFDEDSKSILSGKFIVNTKYLTTDKKELWTWRGISGALLIALIAVAL